MDLTFVEIVLPTKKLMHIKIKNMLVYVMLAGVMSHGFSNIFRGVILLCVRLRVQATRVLSTSARRMHARVVRFKARAHHQPPVVY